VTAAVASLTATAARPDGAVARRAFRQLRNGALAVGCTSGAVAAASAVTYVQSFPTVADRVRLANSLKGDAAFSVLFGRIDAIGTVGGYTAYKSFATITTIGALWAAFAATRLLRGEEDAGRWQMVLAGRTNAARTTGATFAALFAAIGLVFAGTFVPMALAGLKSDLHTTTFDALVLGLSAVVTPIAFVAVGAVCSQLATTRRLANLLSMAVLGVVFVVRMVADAGPGTRWLLWCTPFGWAEMVKPMYANDLWPLVPAAVLGGAAVALTIVAAARRDTGDGVFAAREGAAERRFGLRSPLGLATRLSGPVLGAWLAGMAASAFVLGIVAKPAAKALDDSSATSMIRRLGSSGVGAPSYLGVVFLLLGAMLALVPASQIGSAAEEETSGRLGQLLAGRVNRRRWLGGRLLLGTASIAGLALLAGVAAWAGARSQGVPLGAGRVVLAGVNTIPAALVVLALGALVLAVAPRRAATAVYGIVAWSFVIDLLASLVAGLRPMTRASIFHYVTLAPAVDPDWTALAVLTVIAVAVAVAALVALERRDLARD
jgi:ABC-2 type transport system permease protein